MNADQQLDLFPETALLHCIDLAQNKRRFYRLSIQPTLFGEWSVIREWGRIGRSGQAKLETMTNYPDAVGRLRSLRAQKTRRGYR